MKNLRIGFAIAGLGLMLSSCGMFKTKEVPFEMDYSVNLNDRSNDTFKVSLEVSGLKEEENIFQFASTAPGTYQVMNIGRYVSNFKAFDSKGNSLLVTPLGINQYRIAKTPELAKITYEIAETWDTKVEKNPIYEMCGTSIEEDHVLINGQGVFGYFLGKQSSPMSIDIDYPSSWKVGTAMSKDAEGDYIATSYDYLVDSPILLGNLTRASKMVEQTEVEVYTYSKTGLINSSEVLEDMNDMLFAASKFVDGLPVNRYTFLYLFEDRTAGAWEHSYSSEYIYAEGPWEQIGQGVVETAAHEFFHVITPLNIHSEIIQEFNFVTPVPSQHLWLYEGTTEWASHMMLLQDGLTTLDDYLGMLHQKVQTDKSFYDPNYSLVELALNSYSEDGQRQYGNIYMRGALVAGLLDLKLLDLSNGSLGLRDLMNKLSKVYGPNTPFDEATFFQTVTDMTYPEIGEFINAYIKGTEKLPFKELYATVGINYEEELVNPEISSLNLSLYPTGRGMYVIQDKGDLKRGDFILAVDGKAYTNATAQQVNEALAGQAVGSTVKLSLVRQEKQVELGVSTEAKVDKDLFELMKNPTKAQQKRQEIWKSPKQ